MYGQWKQRLYAFLIRRVVGPYLDSSSLQQLYQSVEVSLKDGILVLKDVELNATYLTSLLRQGSKEAIAPVAITRARIRKLQINLALEEAQSRRSSSVAWKAVQLGRTSSAANDAPHVSLVCHLEIDGLYIEIEPSEAATASSLHTPPSPQPSTPAADEANASSMLASYVDAAMSSLRLSAQLNDLQIQLGTPRRSGERRLWVEVRLASAYYHDVESQPARNEAVKQAPKMRMALHKGLDFSGLTIQTGSQLRGEDDSSQLIPIDSSVIGKTEGSGQIALRVLEYSPENSADDSTEVVQIQHDIEINLNQRLNVILDLTSLHRILEVTTFILEPDPSGSDASDSALPEELPLASATQKLTSDNKNEEKLEEEDILLMTGIFKQYAEARNSVLRNETRGGILVPRSMSEDGDEGGSVGFDAFFDANDQSFYHYTSILERSALGAGSGESEESHFMHARVKFHLRDCGVKLVFPDSSRREESTTKRVGEEYMLISISDIGISSSLSILSSDFSFTMSHLTIEDSRLTTTAYSTRTEIGNILRFTQDAEPLTETVSEAPCVSLDLKVHRRRPGIAPICSVEMVIEPVEIVLQLLTLSNLGIFLDKLKSMNEKSVTTSSEPPKESNMKWTVSCPLVLLSLPLLEGYRSVTGGLCDRCGYVLPDNKMSKVSSIEVALELVSLSRGAEQNLCENGHEEVKDPLSYPLTSDVTQLSCHALIASVVSPKLDSRGSPVVMQRLDILSVSGPSPILLAYRRSSPQYKNSNARSSFPLVPNLSSFKARQDDDDEDRNDDLLMDEDCRPSHESGGRASDPQAQMQEEAAKCDSLLEVDLPEIVGDLTKLEAITLAAMICSTLSALDREATDPGLPDNPRSFSSLSLLVKLDQATLAVHHQIEGKQTGKKWYSFKLLAEDCKIHGVFKGSRLNSARLLSHEANLYEGRDMFSAVIADVDQKLDDVRNRTDWLRRRCRGSETSSVTPLLYRSMLFSALSPENPSFLIDILSTAHASAHSGDGWSVHFTLYNVTHRYDVMSGWYKRVMELVHSPIDGVPDAAESTIDARKEDLNDSGTEQCSLVKLFVSLADCNIDYTSPVEFDNPARLILRVGDLRASSNIVSPAGPVQAYRLSVGDVTASLCNTRFSHDTEDKLLTRAGTVLSTVNHSVPVSADKILHQMNLITMMTVDSFDMSLAKRVALTSTQKKSGLSDPNLSIGLTFGNVCLYGCKDSFACFADTIGELQLRITSLNKDAIRGLKAIDDEWRSKKIPSENIFNDYGETSVKQAKDASTENPLLFEYTRSTTNEEFALDGYDWTTVDHEWSKHGGLDAGDEQSAGWYGGSDSEGATKLQSQPDSEKVHILAGHGDGGTTANTFNPTNVKIIANHIAAETGSDPMDMDTARLAQTADAPPVEARIFVRDLKLRCRFFDGYDWPLSKKRAKGETRSSDDFVIEENIQARNKARADLQKGIEERIDDQAAVEMNKKAELLGDLLDKQGEKAGNTFQNAPLPEERSLHLNDLAEQRRLARRIDRFFQVSLSGLKLRVDTFARSDKHLLASCMDLSIGDFFLAETISGLKPVKVLGEWLNEIEHPRISSDGLIMMKSVTWHPQKQVSNEDEILSDECIVRVQILPLRCRLDQRVVRFAQAFFSGENDGSERHSWMKALELKEIPPPRFVWFKVKPCKMKVNYNPTRVNMEALRDGSYVELINLSPLVDMVIVLQEVLLQGHVGYGAAIQEMLSRWIEDICATQMYKFVTNAKPFQPFTSVSEGAVDLFAMPWQAYKEGDRVGAAFRSGALSFAETFAYEALNTTAQLAEFTGQVLSPGVAPTQQTRLGTPSSLPSRPQGTPRGVRDTGNHALESMARGLEAANYKVVIIPYREYQRSGTSGAMRSVMRGIPVAVTAPLGAASEALSYTLLGVRNQVRPDVRKEEEASERGLHHDF